VTEPQIPKQPKTPSPDKLAKPTREAGVELSESALDQASGGAVFPSGPATQVSQKCDTALIALLHPAEKPGT
jgi:hypothetical protein